MKNVFEIRKENENYCIFPMKTAYIPKCRNVSVAVVIHLHYEETLRNYYKYIENIPNEMDIILTSSEDDVLNKIRKKYSNQENITILKKENRGRDLSAFLVTCRDLIKNYEYFCFAHDKSANKEKFKTDVDVWIRGLWENTIGSTAYIWHVINYFENDPNCGLLVPPEPFGPHIDAWYSSAWYKNFESTAKLANEMGLDADICEEYPPLALGSVFWCRIDAIVKLLKPDWKYSDFPDEPMDTDGTISHAIERILPYVVQDAGYETKTVMTVDFCKTLLSFLQYNANSLSVLLRKYIGTTTVVGMDYRHRLETAIPAFFDNHKSVYLYGAGTGGRQCLAFLIVNGYVPTGFVISDEPKDDSLLGYPLMSFDDIKDDLRDTGIIVSILNTSDKYEIVSTLEKANFCDFILWVGDEGIKSGIKI